MSDEDPTPSERELRRVPDGGILWTTLSGLVIVRRRKHEWSQKLERLDAAQLARETDRIRGSKFARQWTLRFYVQWLDQHLSQLGWDIDTAAGQHTVDLAEEVGTSLGRKVTRVRIEISSRCVHAYPIAE